MTTHATPLLAALEQLPPHDHLCSIYETEEEHFAVAIPFIRIGLDRGEKCIYIADDGTEQRVRETMAADGIDVDAAIASERLVLGTKEAAYLRGGFFNPEAMLEFWTDAVADARNQGFTALRATGETAWVLGSAPGLDRWMEYESRVNRMLARHNCVVLCQYDRQLFPPELVLDAIRTHPTIIHRGVLYRNVPRAPVDDSVDTDEPEREVERLLASLHEREGSEAWTRGRSEREVAGQAPDVAVGQSHPLAGRLLHAQDDDRRRIAQMLHETTAQDLAALKMHLARLSRTASHLADADRSALSESVALADQSITAIRRLSYLLHPPLLDEMGLLSALRWYAAGFARRSGIDVNLELPESLERLPLATETALFRIVQESLSNIHRHAQSDTARIGLRTDAGMFVLEIADHGRGIPEHARRGGGVVGLGIAVMIERIDQLGGHLEIESTDDGGTGTTVRVRLPLIAPSERVP
jgi:signal transduction histidine kinase